MFLPIWGGRSASYNPKNMLFLTTNSGRHDWQSKSQLKCNAPMLIGLHIQKSILFKKIVCINNYTADLHLETAPDERQT